jgi:pimeloyl-ACP methyl ester carboxylesterase
MHVFYLHGFASSAQSRKATYLAERFRAHGVTLRCPDFNEPDFATLTTTRMLEQVAGEIAAAGRGPVTLIGSSLGGVVAIHTAARLLDRVDRLVLLAPAVMFPKDADKVLGAGRVAEWRRTGTLDVLHHANGATRPLNYAFYEDSLQYDAMAALVPQPALIFQGVRDDAVDPRIVQQYAALRPHMLLTLLDDDHQLIASLPRIWSDMTVFLGLT